MLGFMTSTVGKKYLMGLCGLVWAGFVFTHMAGNLLLFIGADTYNAYGHALTSGKIIYVAEAVLVLALIGHVVLAINLTLQNRNARPDGYAMKPSCQKAARFGSRWMGVQGTIILFFIINHLIMFKYGPVYMTTVDGVQMRDLHKLIVETFRQPVFVGWYAVALLILCVHLSHGMNSMFQSFGLLHPTYQPLIKKFAWTYAIVVAGGFLAQPIYVYLIAGA